MSDDGGKRNESILEKKNHFLKIRVSVSHRELGLHLKKNGEHSSESMIRDLEGTMKAVTINFSCSYFSPITNPRKLSTYDFYIQIFGSSFLLFVLVR